MLQRLLGEKRYHYSILFLYAIIVLFLPVNKPVLSVTIVVLTTFVFLGHSPKDIGKRILEKKSFFWIALLFLWILASLGWSENVQQGFKFINLIIPFFLFIFAFLIHPVQSKKERDGLLWLFILSVFVTTFINFTFYIIRQHDSSYDMREMSLFISHIRLSLMVALAVLFSFYFLLTLKGRLRFCLIPLILFFIYYTNLSEVVSGVIALTVLFVGAIIHFIYRSFKVKRAFYLSLSLFLFAILVVGFFAYRSFSTQPAFQVLAFTAEGNRYKSDTSNIMYENGTPIDLNICYKELYREWLKRSNVGIETRTAYGQPLVWNLIRYMASKGLNKDAQGVRMLTNQDIQRIEDGYVSILDGREDFYARYLRLKDEYTSIGMNPNGYTYLQRVRYWKTGLEIFASHPLIGVGVGDALQVFQNYYDKNDSPLVQENRRTSHQQFLSIGVSYGSIGLILFLLFLIYSFKNAKESIVGILAMSVIVFSFLNEDTMETMAGALLCAFVFGLFSVSFFQRPNQKERLSNQNDQKEN